MTFSNYKIIQFFKLFIIEAAIIIAYLFVLNNYIGKVQTTIVADGVGYYDYLPSIFIHKDINRHNSPRTSDSELYNRVNLTGVYVDYEDYKVNMYPAGTAFLNLPFFAITYFTTNLDGNDNDGYQKPFQMSIFYAAIFYLFLALIFLRKVLELYDVKSYIIVISQLILVFATPVAYYVHFEASFSHVYSLFAITALVYFAKSYFKNGKFKDFLWASAFFGLVFILRQVNVLVLVFIPFLAGSFDILKERILALFEYWKYLIFGVLIFFLVASIQFLVWYLQTGVFLLYSYQNYGFNWLQPEFFNILFSFKKGLFIYTPVLIFSLIGLIWFALKKKYFFVFSWLFAFLFITYVFSAWGSWFYGCSFGLRAYIDFFTLFLIPIALMVNGFIWVFRILIILIMLAAIPVNMIQVYQYKEYILHWIDMDSVKYRQIFLKTSEKYKGLLWKRHYDLYHYRILKEIDFENVKTPIQTSDRLLDIKYSEIPEIENLELIMVEFDGIIREADNTHAIFCINYEADKRNFLWRDIYLVHFQEEGFDKMQKGIFFFEIPASMDNDEKIMTFDILTMLDEANLKNVKIKFLARNN